MQLTSHQNMKLSSH